MTDAERIQRLEAELVSMKNGMAAKVTMLERQMAVINAERREIETALQLQAFRNGQNPWGYAVAR